MRNRLIMRACDSIFEWMLHGERQYIMGMIVNEIKSEAFQFHPLFNFPLKIYQFHSIHFKRTKKGCSLIGKACLDLIFRTETRDQYPLSQISHNFLCS